MGTIRLYLAVSVAAWHFSDHPSAIMARGEFDVFIFYMISGFYMSLVLNERYAKLPLWSFYRARALRLYPIYFVLLALSLFMIVVYGQPNFVRPWRAPIDFHGWWSVIVSNLTFFNLNSTAPDQRVISVAWTLGIELQFYLIAPFLVTRRIEICFAVLAAALAERFWLVSLHYDRYTYAPAVWCFFLMGHIAHRVTAPLDQQKLRAWGWPALALLIATAYLCDLSHIDLSFPDLDQPKYWAFYVVAMASLPPIFGLSKAWALDRQIGELSYPVYVSHLLVGGWALRLLQPRSETWLLAIIVAAAGILYRYVQRPIDRIRHSAPSPMPERSAALNSAPLACPQSPSVQKAAQVADLSKRLQA